MGTDYQTMKLPNTVGEFAGAPLLLFYCFVDGRDLEGASIIDCNLALNNAIDHLYWASLSRDFPSPSHLDPSKSM